MAKKTTTGNLRCSFCGLTLHDGAIVIPGPGDANICSDCAKMGVNSRVDNAMLTSSISVEAQEADANSLLNVYKTWSRLRNIYPALANGTMAVAPYNGGSLAAWYMSSGNQVLLVLHNTSSARSVTVTDDTSHPVAVLGTATIAGETLKLGANSSVVFQIQ